MDHLKIETNLELKLPALAIVWRWKAAPRTGAGAIGPVCLHRCFLVKNSSRCCPFEYFIDCFIGLWYYLRQEVVAQAGFNITDAICFRVTTNNFIHSLYNCISFSYISSNNSVKNLYHLDPLDNAILAYFGTF